VTRMNKDTRKEKHSVIASLDLAVNTVIIWWNDYELCPAF
jgi:hypothetical protein